MLFQLPFPEREAAGWEFDWGIWLGNLLLLTHANKLFVAVVAVIFSGTTFLLHNKPKRYPVGALMATSWFWRAVQSQRQQENWQVQATISGVLLSAGVLLPVLEQVLWILKLCCWVLGCAHSHHLPLCRTRNCMKTFISSSNETWVTGIFPMPKLFASLMFSWQNASASICNSDLTANLNFCFASCVDMTQSQLLITLCSFHSVSGKGEFGQSRKGSFSFNCCKTNQRGGLGPRSGVAWETWVCAWYGSVLDRICAWPDLCST